MTTYIQNFIKYKDLLYELVIRDVKIKYRRSTLGLLWSLLNPLFMMIIMTIVFSHLFRFDIKNYPIYLLSGQIIFTFFSESTNISMRSIIDNAPLIKKVYIPKYIFPVAKVLSSFINLIFSLLAILIVIIAMRIKISLTILLFPIPLLFVLMFSIGMGLILSSYAVFFRDMIHLYSVGLTAWTYITPIFYPKTIIPEKYRLLVELNPMYHYIEYFRDILINGKIPSINQTMICLIISIFFIVIGTVIFYKKQNDFILYV
ncbi:ABC transporter permease [Caldicellulosiruptoraceae bacterium PP1]